MDESVSSMSSVPTDAPEHCPGTTSADAGKSTACEGCPNQQICATSSKAVDPDIELIRKRMSSIKKKVPSEVASYSIKLFVGGHCPLT